MSADPRTEFTPRPVRVTVPVRVEFEGERFLIDEFTANLSEGGIFLTTARAVPAGARGRLTFRITQWDDPFTVDAEVVRVVGPDDGESSAGPGLGIRFLDLRDRDRQRLQRLVSGLINGSVVETLRRNIRESPRSLEQELRHRPTDQKMMLAICAQGEEIDALVRDGHPSVIERMFRNPRLMITHIRNVARDPRMNTKVLLEIRKRPKWFADEEVRFQFCKHPKAPFHEVVKVLPTLSIPHLQQLSLNANLTQRVRMQAREAAQRKRRGGGF